MNGKKLIRWALFGLILLLPLLENILGYDSCQLPRLVLLRLVTLVIIGIWLIQIIESHSDRDKPCPYINLVRTPLDLPILVFVFIAILSTLTSVHLPTSVSGEAFGFRYEGLLTVLNYLLLFYLLVNFIQEEEWVSLFVTALLASAALVSIYGIFQHFGYDFIPASLYGESFDIARSFSTFGNAFFLGAYLSLVFPVSLALLVTSHRLKIPYWLIFSSTLLTSVCLVFTYTRSAWLGTLAAIIFIGAFTYKRAWRSRSFVPALLILVLTVIFFAALPSPFKEAYQVTGRVASLLRPGQGASASRIITWKTGLSMVRDYPILGTGPDTYGLVFPKYRPAHWAKITGGELTNKAHNDLLQVAATMGLLGLFSYLWLLIAFCGKGISWCKRARDENQRALLIALFAGCLAYLIQLQFGFTEVSTTPIFWTMAGLVIILGRGLDSGATISLDIPMRRLKVGDKLAIYLIILLLGIALASQVITPLRADRALRKALDYEAKAFWGEALAEYRRAARLVPDEEYLIRLGNAYYKRAKGLRDPAYLSLSAKVFKKGQGVNPLDERSYFYLGEAYIYGGLNFDPSYFGKAVDELRQVIRLDPYFVRPHVELGVAYLYQGKVEEAIKEWQFAIELDPKLLDPYFYLAEAYLDRGMKDRAIRLYEKILQINPKAHLAQKALEELK